VATHIEDFRVSDSPTQTVAACHRGLSTFNSVEQTSDRHEVPLPIIGDWGELIVGLLALLPVTRPLVKRYTMRTARAPEGPPDADAEINAVLRVNATQPMNDLLVRISVRDRGGFGTDVAISGANLLATRWGADALRSEIRKLHQAIESESRNPSQTPTPRR